MNNLPSHRKFVLIAQPSFHPAIILQWWHKDGHLASRHIAVSTGDQILEDFLKVLGECNSLLHKQSPITWTNEKLSIFNLDR